MPCPTQLRCRPPYCRCPTLLPLAAAGRRPAARSPPARSCPRQLQEMPFPYCQLVIPFTQTMLPSLLHPSIAADRAAMAWGKKSGDTARTADSISNK